VQIRNAPPIFDNRVPVNDAMLAKPHVSYPADAPPHTREICRRVIHPARLAPPHQRVCRPADVKGAVVCLASGFVFGAGGADAVDCVLG